MTRRRRYALLALLALAVALSGVGSSWLDMAHWYVRSGFGQFGAGFGIGLIGLSSLALPLLYLFSIGRIPARLWRLFAFAGLIAAVGASLYFAPSFDSSELVRPDNPTPGLALVTLKAAVFPTAVTMCYLLAVEVVPPSRVRQELPLFALGTYLLRLGLHAARFLSEPEHQLITGGAIGAALLVAIVLCELVLSGTSEQELDRTPGHRRADWWTVRMQGGRSARTVLVWLLLLAAIGATANFAEEALFKHWSSVSGASVVFDRLSFVGVVPAVGCLLSALLLRAAGVRWAVITMATALSAAATFVLGDLSGGLFALHLIAFHSGMMTPIALVVLAELAPAVFYRVRVIIAVFLPLAFSFSLRLAEASLPRAVTRPKLAFVVLALSAAAFLLLAWWYRSPESSGGVEEHVFD